MEAIIELLWSISKNKQILEVIRIYLVVIPLTFTCLVIASSPTIFRKDTFSEFLFQVLFVTSQLVLTFTVGAKIIYSVLSPLMAITFFISSLYFLRKWNKNGTLEILQIYMDDRPRSITFFRSSVDMITSCAILACDFKIFPHSFHKTRSFGVGLMDTGIGLFVFAMGVVSRPVTNKRALKSMITQVSVLLVLGIIRTVVLRTIHYSYDVNEYGRDFNSFITLGLTKLIGALLLSIIPAGVPILFSAIAAAVVHEGILQSGMGKYCLSKSVLRISFLEANREGLISITGFVSIYLISVFIGSLISKDQRFNFECYKTMMLKLSAMSVISFILTIFSVFTTDISRRIANFGYITWIVSLSTTLIITYSIALDVMLKAVHNNDRSLPAIFEMVNFNGLIYFLTSNIFTGLVNIYLNPNEKSSTEGICILIIYMILPCMINRLLYVKRIRIS
ncbi:PIGW family protein [Megaselia abdita]